MSSSPKYTVEVNIEMVRPVTERGFAVKEMAARLGVSNWSLYQWIKRYGKPAEKRLAPEIRTPIPRTGGFRPEAVLR